MNQGSHRTVGTVLGIPWKLTPTAWLFLPSRLGLGLTVAFVFLGSLGVGARLAYGVGFGLVTVLSQIVHIVGHTLGAQFAHAPMAANLILGTKILTDYPNDPVDLPGRVHLLRAGGGPIANLVAVGLWAGLAAFIPNPLVYYGLAVNLGLGLLILLPLPGLDGHVVWHVLRGRPGPP